MRGTIHRRLITGTLAVCVAAPAWPAWGQTQFWVRQVGTPGSDGYGGASADGLGHVYVGGSTSGSLGGPQLGNGDAILTKYHESGAVVWTRQFGTPGSEGTWPVAVDGAGHVYAGGVTRGNLAGPHLGNGDAFLAKYDATGSQLWVRQLSSPQTEEVKGLAVDAAGRAYLSGTTLGTLGGFGSQSYDVFVAAYDPTGNLLWVWQNATWGVHEQNASVARDAAGHAYVCWVAVELYGNVYVAKLDPSGAVLWTRQFGTPEHNSAWDVAVDSAGNAYVTGGASGNLGGPNAGGADLYLAKYDSTGTQLWIRQYGTPQLDVGREVGVNAQGHVYVGGATEGDFGGPYAGGIYDDAFVAKFDSTGQLLWKRQLGSSSPDDPWALAVEEDGAVYVGGGTGGDLGGPSAGGYDAWLAKFGDACYPDCNTDGSLTVADFGCFQTKFVAADPYADCNGDGQRTVADFGCFQTRFVAGCP